MKMWYWLVATVAVFGAATYHVCTIFLQYYEHTVSVGTTFTFQRYAVFPAVTLCNMNPVRQSAIGADSPLSSLMTSTRKKREESRDNTDRSQPVNHKTRFRYKRSSKSKTHCIQIFLKTQCYRNWPIWQCICSFSVRDIELLQHSLRHVLLLLLCIQQHDDQVGSTGELCQSRCGCGTHR